MYSGYRFPPDRHLVPSEPLLYNLQILLLRSEDGIGVSIYVSADTKFEPRHEISNDVVCATSKSSDPPERTHSLTRDIACRLNIL